MDKIFLKHRMNNPVVWSKMIFATISKFAKTPWAQGRGDFLHS